MEQTGNKVIDGNFLRVLEALKGNINRNLNVAEIVIIKNKNSDGTYTCELLNKPETLLTCYSLNPSVTYANDTLALVVFSNSDFRVNLLKHNSGGNTQEVNEKIYHSKDYGIIIVSSSNVQSFVTSVNNKTGAVVLDAEDVGALPASTVIPTKTSDLINDEFIRYDINNQGLNDTQKDNARTNLGLGSAATKNTGTSDGNIPVLDSNGKLADSVIPAIAITDTFVANSQAAMLALDAQVGDVCVRTDLNKSFILQVAGASTLSHWVELLTPTDAVTSVNGRTGAVTGLAEASDLANYVTLNTAQTISGAKTLSTDLTFNASGQTQLIWKTSGTTTGFIRSGISGSDKYIVTQADKHYWGSIANTNRVIFDPVDKSLRSETNENISLGTSGYRWKSIYAGSGYFGNGVYDYGSIAIRGVHANANYAGYFLVAYVENVPTYQPVTAKIIAEDFDTVGSCYEIDVSAYFGFDSTNNVKVFTPRVRAISSTGSDPVAFSKNNIFVVMRTTNSTASGGTNRVEIWYRGTATYSRFKFTFLYDAGQVKTDSIVKWTKVMSTHATDQGYVSAGNIVYLDSSNQFPTFIPTASWSTNAFITSQYVAANISANSMGNMMSASVFRAFATTPNIEGYMAGDDYNTTPSANQGAQFLARDKNGQWMGGLRVYHTTSDNVQTQLIARSPKTSTYSTGVMIEQDASATSNNQAGKCRFIPFGNETVDLGATGAKWRNIYGTTVSTQYYSNISTGRPSSLNFSHYYDTTSATKGKVHCRLDIAAGTQTGKPKADGYVLTCFWDNIGKYDAQFYIPNSKNNPQVRYADNANFNSQTWYSIPLMDWSSQTGSFYATNIYASSDRRLKENIKDAELNCGEVIDKLPIKEFNFKSDEDKKVVVGAIAQELMEILPEKYRATLVSGSEDTSYSINEGKLLYVAIGALKDEMKKTKDLEERLEKLEKMLGV